MIGLLLMIVIGLGGLLAATVFGGLSLDAIPELPTAASVIGTLIALYLATLLSHRRERHLALWPTLAACIAGAALVAGAYNKSSPLVLADLFAAKPAEAPLKIGASASVRIRRRDDGGFFANSEVNGEAMGMRLDSGAATVVLRQSDAEKAGIDGAGSAEVRPHRTGGDGRCRRSRCASWGA